ncbi:MAG: hypothetical protein AAF149_20435 [Bacteroidota bacterium]
MRKKVLITIKEGFISKIDSVSENLKQYDIEISETLPFGVISASMEDKMIPSISIKEYVDRIEYDDEVSIS